MEELRPSGFPEVFPKRYSVSSQIGPVSAMYRDADSVTFNL
jgi:hypothetical protein